MTHIFAEAVPQERPQLQHFAERHILKRLFDLFVPYYCSFSDGRRKLRDS
jgi:hypothetical protein